MDCFAEPVIGRRYAPTRWLAMTMWMLWVRQINPTGKSAKPVQLSRKKYFCFSEMQISLLNRPSHPIEGRFAIVTSVAVGCGGRGLRNGRVRMRRTAKSCGPDAPTLASSP
jgi:hypothetical protein